MQFPPCAARLLRRKIRFCMFADHMLALGFCLPELCNHMIQHMNICCILPEQLRNAQRSAKCHDGIRMRRTNDFIFRQLQTLTKYTHQRRIEGQRASFKNYRRRDVQTLRQTADGLLGNRMKRRQRNIFPCTARIEHRLNICFGEHAASSADAVHGFSLTGKRLKALCRCLEQRCNLINKCACAARTAAVHAHIARDELSCVFIVLEKDNLCVLSAQFNRRARLRIQMPHRRCIGNNFLYKMDTRTVGNRLAAAAANCDAERCLRECLAYFFQQQAHRVHLLCMVSAVPHKQRFWFVRFYNCRFYRCGTDIQSQQKIFLLSA